MQAKEQASARLRGPRSTHGPGAAYAARILHATGNGGQEGDAGSPVGSAAAAQAQGRADGEDVEEERNAVLTSSIVGPRAACYANLVAALFAGLERAAAANGKYRDVCRLENYAFFADAVSAATDGPARQQKRNALPGGGDDNDDDGVDEKNHASGGACGPSSSLEQWHELDGAVAGARAEYGANLAR